MLVLSRKPGESIRIGNDILITVTEVRGGRVKIGISAPDACTIRRGELEDWTESAQPAAKSKAATSKTASEAPITSSQANSTRRQKVAALQAERQIKVSQNRIRLAMEVPSNPISVS